MQKSVHSVEKAFRHMRFLVNEIGERLAGTKKMEQAAEYVKDQMEKWGLETKIDNFHIYQSYPKEAKLRVVLPETRVITAKPLCHIASTLPEGIEGELVYVGAGGYAEYEGKDVEGKIVLADMSWAPPRPEKARIAYEKGAKALIVMNWGSHDNPVIQLGAIKGQWGNPTPDTIGHIPQIVAISITRAAGEYLKDLCAKGTVKVWLRAEASREWVLASQPVGILRGKERPEEFILIGSHLEGWGRTAICNSSGNALTLELARAFSKYKETLKRSIIFAFWDGHEVAEAAGSTWFVDTNWDDLAQHCVAYVNIDNPGILGTSVPKVQGVCEIEDFMMRTVRQVWGREGEWHDMYKGGDASFFGVGVPYMDFYTAYTPEKLKELNYASLSPWIHSEMDTIDKIDKALFAKHMAFFSILIYRLCNTLIIPYNPVSVADRLIRDLETLKSAMNTKLPGFPVNLNSLLGKAQLLKEYAIRLMEESRKITRLSEESGDEQGKIKRAVNVVNKAFRKVSWELSPIMRSEAGRYGHDPYGYSMVGEPIPRLYVSIAKLAELSEQSEEFKLWQTKLIRERNRVSDAINNCVDYIELTLSLLQELVKGLDAS